jgi:hypothetical protein
MKNTDKIKRRKADTKRKSIYKAIRFTQNEWHKIEQNLKKENLTFSEFARASILNKKIKKTPKAKKELLFELNKIGNNLNQITRLVNEKKAIDLQTLKAIFEIKEQLGKLS